MPDVQTYTHIAASTDVQAVWLNASNLDAAAAWCKGTVEDGGIVHPDWDGLYTADPGEWLVREPDGEYTVVPAELFQSEFRLAEQAA